MELRLLNKIIKESIDHGGDSGGPYLINEEALIKAMEDYLKYKNKQDIWDIEIVEVDGHLPKIPQFVLLAKGEE